MKRRDFLKLLTVAPSAPSMLVAKEVSPTGQSREITDCDGSTITATVGSFPTDGYFYLKWSINNETQT